MESIFLKLFNMSITASYLVLAVLILRVVLKNSPKAFRVSLWIPVAVRLLCPLSFESILSLIPSSKIIEVRDNSIRPYVISSGFENFDRGVNDFLDDRYAEGITVPTGSFDGGLKILSILWLVGIAVMILYVIISCLKVRFKLSESVLLRENIYLCDRISTPFIFGVLSPKIYLPSNINEDDSQYVIAHEKAHIKRRDHFIKPFGFLLLTVYWFNPFLWLCYILLCRDIELACDERVIKEMGTGIKKPYSDALVNCSTKEKIITACPLAFGEVGVKKRIKSVLNYKKPAFWVSVISVAALLGVCVFFLTDPPKYKDLPMNENKIYSGEYIYSNGSLSIAHEELSPLSNLYKRSGNKFFAMGSVKVFEDTVDFIPLSLTSRNFDALFSKDDIFKGKINPEDIRKENKAAFRVFDKKYENYTYLILEQRNLDLLLFKYSDVTADDGSDFFIYGCKLKEEDSSNFISDADGKEGSGSESFSFIASTAFANYNDDLSLFTEESENLLTLLESSVPHLSIFKFGSPKELSAFREKYKNTLEFEKGFEACPSFDEVTEDFDEKYFSKYEVLLIYAPSSSSAEKFSVDSVDFKDNKMTVKVKCDGKNEAGDSVMGGYWLILSAEKERVKDIEFFDSYLILDDE